ncbi:hypothetical protein IEQ34_005780 [Dendrobium chrysotoxum]|uniref:Uncharacterized protein n=1 Tax=Dendrobium chrysotoxum TaxID=161865 RepID=A0AAV7HCS6_DENCH|nr:hypothetical protein IEQ34_005780 [Dendrobium chrysotoxum]
MIQKFDLTMKLKEEIVKLAGLEEDECLQLLDSCAFASMKKPPVIIISLLRAIAGEVVKNLLRSLLATKVICGVLKKNFWMKEHWRTVLESNLLGQKPINSILRMSYIVLPKYLQNCFAFCCMFPQDLEFGEGDLVLTYGRDDQKLVDILRSIRML